MLAMRPACLSLGFLFVFTACKQNASATKTADQPEATSDGDGGFACGKPLIDALASHGLAGIDKKSEADALAAVSASNMQALKAAVGNMNDDEKKLYEASKQNPYGNTHRGAFRSLHRILSSGAIIAPNASGSKISVKVTPPPEDELYGAFSCVFTAVGPIEGRERYGDTIIHVKDIASVPAWGTFSSAYTLMKGQRSRSCDVQCECAKGQSGQVPAGASCATNNDSERFTFAGLGDSSCDDFCQDTAAQTMTDFTPGDDLRVAYGKTLIAPQDWKEWFAYTLISMLRGKDDRATYTRDLLAIAQQPEGPDRALAWWTYVDAKWLGYIEAKYEGKTTLEDIVSIEVPADKYDETQSWTDVAPAMRAKISKVAKTGP